MLYKNVPPNEIYARMVAGLLPPGLKGLVVAALLAALMSSLSSVFNSSSTLVVMDFYRKWRPQADQKELVRAGQVTTLVLVVVGLLWLPFLGLMSDQLYVYLQSVQAYISPPIAAVFLLGIFSRRITSAAALTVLIGGFGLGAIRFITELAVKAGYVTWEPLVGLASINFLHFAVLLFAISAVGLVLVSAFTAKPTADNLAVAYSDKDSLQPSEKGGRTNLLLSGLLVVIILGFWLWFSPLVFR